MGHFCGKICLLKVGGIMGNWKQYFHQPKEIEELIQNAVVVVDTNVLLSAYQWRNVTVEEVLKTLEKLSEEDRLKIPYQVVKEFSKNRPKVIKDRLNEIETTINSIQKQKALNERVPMLEGHEVFEKADELLNKFNSTANEYKNALKEVRDKIRELFTYDPYLNRLSKIIERSFYIPEDMESDDKLKELASERFKQKKPPGYKDNEKEENSEGDFIIWHTIKKIKRDVIFISNDKKADWVYRDKHEESISARRELIEEFYVETDGKDFIHLSPKEFISHYNPNVSKVIEEDLNADKSLRINHKLLNIKLGGEISSSYTKRYFINKATSFLKKYNISDSEDVYYNICRLIFEACYMSNRKEDKIRNILNGFLSEIDLNNLEKSYIFHTIKILLEEIENNIEESD